MKCEHCGKNEVTFIYQSNVNGTVTEKHLCSECARDLGYTKQFAARNQRMMQDFFGNSFFGGGLLSDFFAPMPGLMGRMNRMLEDPFDDFFAEMPALRGNAPQKTEEQPPQKQDALVEQEEQEAFSRQRKLNALRMEMRKAVEEENFERAAQLRDEIRKLDGGNRPESA